MSPGSRCAPLTISFARHKGINDLLISDERSAGFVALGIAQQTKRPVAVICTSGSALLNYYPALAEAFYSQIPFIVISADRPFDKIDIGDGQTIRQENVYINHSLYNANLTEEASEENDVFIAANNTQQALNGDKVKITSRRGTITMKADINGRGKPQLGEVFVPFFDEKYLINDVTLDAYCPISKQPDYKKCAVKIEKA